MKFSMFFCKEILNKNHPPAVSPNPTNTYIIHLQEKHKLSQKNSPAAIKTARLVAEILASGPFDRLFFTRRYQGYHGITVSRVSWNGKKIQKFFPIYI
jgi:hypothetical protein